MNRLLFFVLSLCVTCSAWAEVKISDIQVEGLQRVSAGTVFSAMPLQVGDEIDAAVLRHVTHQLFRTGYFADVQIGLDGSVLVLRFLERPAVDEVVFEGNKAIKTEDLMKNLNNNGVGEGQIFKRTVLEGLTQELRRQYVAQGRYSASVDTEVEELSGNRVKLNITIDEGKVAAIKHINIVGNQAFDDDKLRELFELNTTGMWSWLNGNDKYAKEKLKGDIERLESFYLDRGYLKFKIDSTQVSVSPDRKAVFITVNVSEGDVYSISEIDLAGDLVVPEEDVRRLIIMKPEQTFSQMLMTTSSDYITQRLGNAGYTFAEVRGIPEMDDEEKTVKVTFFMEPGKRVYVRRIEFRGNTKTADEVMRREMRQIEAASANSALIERSRLRLDRLGFFKEVNVDTVEVPGSDDQVDVIYTVEEAPSGSIGASIGYQQGTGMVLGANVSQNNFLGTGNKVSFGINNSPYETSYSFSYTDPYYTEDGVSRGISFFYRERDFEELNLATFSTNSYGGTVSYSYPLSETQRVGFNIGFTNIELITGPFAVQEVSGSPVLAEGVDSYVTQHDWSITQGDIEDWDTTNPGEPLEYEVAGISALDTLGPEDFADVPDGFVQKYGNSFNNFPLAFNWRQSTLNRGRLATRGHSQSLSFEVTTPGSDLEYYKLNYTGQYFQPLTQSLTLRFRATLGYGDGFGKTDELPFFENFYAGGFGSIRGFEKNSLGPKSTSAESYEVVSSKVSNNFVVGRSYLVDGNGKLISNVVDPDPDPFGGNTLVEAGVELLFPMPFIKDQRQMQSTLFIDVGNVFDDNCTAQQTAVDVNCIDFDASKLRASAGIGLTWITGFGPLTFSVAKPLMEEDGDEAEFFQFNMGYGF
ncbi:MAG: outer membrane protein assembly factor BamA [Cellvibrionaceae bacterium]